MSGTREIWAYLTLKVMHLIYEQDDAFMGKSFEECKETIEENISKWKLSEFNSFIIEEFATSDNFIREQQEQALKSSTKNSRLPCYHCNKQKKE